MYFDSKLFFKQKINGKKMELSAEVAKEIRSWDGAKVHKFSKNNVRRKVLGEDLYIFVGAEKIGVSKEFCRNEPRHS